MKIKKIMLGALAAATIATGIGVSNTPVFAAEESNVAVVSEVSTNTITPFPASSLKDEQSFEHNGVKYINLHSTVELSDSCSTYVLSSNRLVESYNVCTSTSEVNTVCEALSEDRYE